MSSVVFRKDRGEIQFRYDGKRRVVRLGKCTKSQAYGVQRHVDAIIVAKATGQPTPRDAAVWLRSVDPKIRKRLHNAGLVTDAERQPETVAELVAHVVATYEQGKPNTLKNIKRAAVLLLEHFPRNARISNVSDADAESFRRYLETVKGMAPTTTGGLCRKARRFFNVAKSAGWIERNPFSSLKGWSHVNEERSFFVTEEITESILSACEPEWQLVVALVRYAGLRCPSELAPLKWSGVDWSANTFVIWSPKTEAYPGGSHRICPIFDRLRPHLEAAWSRSAGDATFVVDRVQGRSDSAIYNGLRRRVRRVCSPWPKLAVNMRGSLITDLVDAGFPLPSVSRWVGNSPAIAKRHYLKETERMIDRASRPLDSKAQ